MSIFARIFGLAPSVIEAKSNVPSVKRSRRSHRNPVKSRGYTAGMNKAYYGDFASSPGSADYELANVLPKVRNKIRAMARNSSAGKRYIRLMRDNVVGVAGFKLTVRVMKHDGVLDTTLNTNVEKAFKSFMRKPMVDGKTSGNQFQKLLVSAYCNDGEVFVERVENAKYPDGFKFNVFEGDLLDETLNTINPNTGNEIRLGVEIDKNGEHVAYHFLHQHPGDMSWVMPRTNTRYRRVSASKILHLYERLRPGQTRGEPPASSVPNSVKMIDGYREAEVTGRRVKASAMGILTESAMADGDTDLTGMADREDTVDDTFEMDVEPGTFKKLPRGLDLEMFDPGGTVSDFSDFEQQLKTDVSMGLNISPVSLGYETAKLSYSTHRGIIGEDREHYRNTQQFFIEGGMEEIFLMWLPSHVAFNVDSKILPSRSKIILESFGFSGRGWDQIDPSKDVKADNEAMASRSKSLSQVVSKAGRSLEEHLREIQQDEQLLSDYGLTQDFGGASNIETKPSSGDDDDE